MKKIVCLIVLAGLIFGINSCKEEVIIEKVITEPETNLNFSIEDAKAWMEFDYQTELNFKSAGKIKKKYKLSQLWKKARRFENDKVVAVEIPLSSVDKFGFLTAETEELMRNTGIFDYALSETSLLIQKNKETGLVTAHFMTIVGDPVYLDKTDFKVNTNKFLKKDKDFSGMVLFHDLSGLFNIGWKYYEGVLTHRISGNTSIESGLRLKGAQTEVICYHIEIYEVVTYYHIDNMEFVVDRVVTNVLDSYDVCEYTGVRDTGGGPIGPEEAADPHDCNCETCPVCHKCLPISLKGATVLPPDEDEETGGTTTSTDETISNCPMCSCPPQTTIPSINSIKFYFNDVAKLEAADVYKLIGGNALANYQSNPSGFSNACAMRLSYCLNRITGNSIPFSTNKTISGDYNGDGNIEWYFYRVADMVEYLNAVYGQCTFTDTDKIKGMTGFIWQSDCGWGDATGHLDVWDGDNALDHYYDSCSDVYIWRN